MNLIAMVPMSTIAVPQGGMSRQGGSSCTLTGRSTVGENLTVNYAFWSRLKLPSLSSSPGLGCFQYNRLLAPSQWSGNQRSLMWYSARYLVI